MIALSTSDPDATREVAGLLAALCQPGDLLVLSGDLGAGKTAFAQGFGRALGIDAPITSPTFTLANEYHGRLTMHHLDVYRIDQLSEVTDLALPELLEGNSVTLIEWGDEIIPALPNDYLEVRLAYGEGDSDRLIELRCIGHRWSARSRAVTDAVRPWMPTAC